jgi:hypothetical protein
MEFFEKKLKPLLPIQDHVLFERLLYGISLPQTKLAEYDDINMAR